jgi:hypothetical protein
MEVTSKQYIDNGVEFDRITSVQDCYQDPDLIDWFKRTGPAAIRNASEKGKSIGSAVHLCIEENEAPGMESGAEIHNCWGAWGQFLKDKDVVVLAQETWLKNDKLGVAGTRDLLLEVNSEKNITVDIKTSNRIRKAYWIQVAMYHFMAKGNVPGMLGILRLDKATGTYEWYTKHYDYKYVQMFRYMLMVYRYYAGVEESIF